MRLLLFDNPFDLSVQIEKRTEKGSRKTIEDVFIEEFPDKIIHNYIISHNGGNVDKDYEPENDGEVIFMLNLVDDSGMLPGLIGAALITVGSFGLALPALGMSAVVAYSLIGVGAFVNAIGGFFANKKVATDFDDSQTYSWDGVQNVIGEGNVIPVVYGKHRVGGIIIEGYVEGTSDNGASDVNYLYMVTALSEGPVEEVLLDTTEINDKLAWMYADAEESVDSFYNPKTNTWQTVAGVVVDSRSKIIEEYKLSNYVTDAGSESGGGIGSAADATGGNASGGGFSDTCADGSFGR